MYMSTVLIVNIGVIFFDLWAAWPLDPSKVWMFSAGFAAANIFWHFSNRYIAKLNHKE